MPPAVALHAVGVNLSRAIGPALGGFLIVALGIAWPFFINALSFVAIIVALWRWRPAPAPPTARAHESLAASIRTGLAHAFDNRQLRNTLLRSIAFYMFGSAYWALLPLVARQQLGGDARLFGILVGCIGAGAVTGALVLPRLRARASGSTARCSRAPSARHSRWLAMRCCICRCLGMLASLIAGAAWIASLSSLNVAAQLAVPDWIRARGMALYTAVFYGCLAAGSLLWGQVATRLTLSAALLLAAGGALLALPLARWLPVQGSR